MLFSVLTLGLLCGSTANAAKAEKPGFVEFSIYKAEKRSSDIVKAGIPAREKLVDAKLENKQFYYQIELGIGTPPQLIEFTIDTGSSDLWVMNSSNPYCTTNHLNKTGINCTNSLFDSTLSSTYQSLNIPFSIEYGDRTMANGTLVEDTISLGGIQITNATFAVANVVNSSTCVFGIGFIGNEAGAHVHKNGSGVYPTYFNVPTLMKQQNFIETNAYSLYLNDINAKEGSILFGGVDRAKYEGDLIVVPVFNNYAEYTDRPIQTRVMLNGIAVDGQSIADFNIAVLLDSGTSFAYLPEEIVNAMGNALGFVYDDNMGFYYGGFDTARNNVKKFNLDFSGAKIDIPLDDLLVGLTVDKNESPLVIDGESQAILAVGKADSDYLYILGDVFLHAMYAVFDIDHYEIALANAKVNVTESNIETIGASIPGAIQAPNYGHTSTNNSSFTIYARTPAFRPNATATAVSWSSASSNATTRSRSTSPCDGALITYSEANSWNFNDCGTPRPRAPKHSAVPCTPRMPPPSYPTMRPKNQEEVWVIGPNNELMPKYQYEEFYGVRKHSKPCENMYKLFHGFTGQLAH